MIDIYVIKECLGISHVTFNPLPPGPLCEMTQLWNLLNVVLNNSETETMVRYGASECETNVSQNNPNTLILEDDVVFLKYDFALA